MAKKTLITKNGNCAKLIPDTQLQDVSGGLLSLKDTCRGGSSAHSFAGDSFCVAVPALAMARCHLKDGKLRWDRYEDKDPSGGRNKAEKLGIAGPS